MASAHDDDDGGEETKKSILMNDVNQDIPIFLRNKEPILKLKLKPEQK